MFTCFVQILGCSTSKVDGSKKLLGVIKIPFTKTVEAMTPEAVSELALVEQFAPFIYASLICIIGGATLWYFTKGTTGMGKFFVLLGLGLSAFAVTMEKYAGIIGLISLIGAVAVTGWMVFDFIIKRKKKEALPTAPPK